MTPITDLRVAECVAATSDFPNLCFTFGSALGTYFKSFTHPDRRCYIFPTDEVVTGFWYEQEMATLNALLGRARESEFSFLVIHAQASHRESEEVINKLLSEYDPAGWTPGPLDQYTDSGYIYSQKYITTTPLYSYIKDKVKDHCPPIYPVVSCIRTWLDSQRTKNA